MKWLAWIVSLAVLAAIVAAFVTVGSPAVQRAKKFDEQRVRDLQSIQNQIVHYWNQKNVLPASLSDLNSSIGGFIVPKDPETGTDYEYLVKGELSFDLCANFNKPSAEVPEAMPLYRPYPDGHQQNWAHAAGHVCFNRTIDPQLDRIPPDKPIPFR